MCRRRFRLVIFAGVGLLVVRLLFIFSRWLTTSSAATGVRIPPPPEFAAVTGHPDGDDFVLGLAEPRQFFERLGQLARTLLPNNGNDTLLEQLRSLFLLEDAKEWLAPSLTSLPRLHPHFTDKLIVVTAGVSVESWRLKRETFLADNCPISNCYLMADLAELPPGVLRPDVVLYKTQTRFLNTLVTGRTRDEIWIVWQLESPISAPMNELNPDQMPNWTASYRIDSTMISPYGKYVTSSKLDQYQLNKLLLPMTSRKDYADGKTKMVAWFVSNCQSSNQRESYVKELTKYTQVDIYGRCGTVACSKADNNCNNMLRKDYKFYLAFENSNCRQYITEKLFENAYRNDIVPVVMGAHPDDYRAVAPPHSYIHVDDFESPRHLADYLKLLDQNDTLYNEYFAWKGTGTFINTKFWCRLCAMLHARDKTNYVHTYKDLFSWWNKDQCVMAGSYGATWRTKPNTTTSRYSDKMTSS